MPLSLSDLNAFITNPPQQMYQGGAGAGMRQAAAMMQQQQAQQSSDELARMAEAGRQARHQDDRLDRARKAWLQAIKTGDRQMLEAAAGELRAAGYTVDIPTSGALPGEGDMASTNADKPSATESVATEPGGAADWLKTYMAGAGTAAPAPEATAEPESPYASIGEASRAAGSSALSIDGLGLGSGAEASSSYRVRDPSGAILFDLDPGTFGSDRAERVKESFTVLKERATTPEEQRAAEIAEGVAVAALGEMEPDKAIEQGRRAYEFELNRYRKMFTGGGMGGGGGGGAGPTKGERFDTETTLKVIRTTEGSFNVRKLRSEIAEAQANVAALDTGDALPTQVTVGRMLHSLSGANATDAEYRRIIAPTVKHLLGGLASYATGDTRFDQDFLRQLKELHYRALSHMSSRLQQAAQTGKALAEQIGGNPAAVNSFITADPPQPGEGDDDEAAALELLK